MQALTELLRGQGAHVDPAACIEDVSADLASRRAEGFPHSIADLVFHMNYWMEYELRRIRGESPHYPEHNAESFAAAGVLNEKEWNTRSNRFVDLLAEFAKLAQSPRAELDRRFQSIHESGKTVSGPVESILWQMVAHNSYHTGQIALIRRALGAWPPRAGGDTW